MLQSRIQAAQARHGPLSVSLPLPSHTEDHSSLVVVAVVAMSKCNLCNQRLTREATQKRRRKWKGSQGHQWHREVNVACVPVPVLHEKGEGTGKQMLSPKQEGVACCRCWCCRWALPSPSLLTPFPASISLSRCKRNSSRLAVFDPDGGWREKIRHYISPPDHSCS